MDGFCVSYQYENDIHLDYSQLYLHPRQMKEMIKGMTEAQKDRVKKEDEGK